MSTRSGKRIHLSLHENTVKSEIELTKSERKTRSKHTKENLDETNVIAKVKKVKKRNYVAYPGHDEGIDTVDGKDARSTRVPRKNALKERNVASSTENEEPISVESRKSVRSTRRTRKFDENAQDIPAEVPHDAEPAEAKLPKPKKSKKKKKAYQEIVEDKVEAKVSKKKSKKKKDSTSGSIVVEDVQLEAPSGLNKSNMLIDSFHSAAGSPGNAKNNDKIATIKIDTVTAGENDLNITETRRTRSSFKLDNTQEIVIVKEPRRRESSVKINIDSNCTDDFEKVIENQDTPGRDIKKRKSSIKDAAISEDKKDTENSTFEVAKLNTRKSLRNTFDKTTPNKNNISFAEEGTSSSQKIKRKSNMNDDASIKDLKPSDGNMNTTFEKDVESSHKGKKRKSSIRVIEDSSPVSNKIKRKSLLNNTVEKVEDLNSKIEDNTFNVTVNSSPITQFVDKTKVVNTTFEKDSKTSQKKKSIVDMTFDMTSSPFKSANEMSSPLIKGNRTSIINTTYEKDAADQEPNDKKSINTTFDKDATEIKINTTFEKDENDKVIKNKRKSLQRLSTHKISDTDINCTFNVDQEKKLDSTFDKNSKSSLISSDNSMITLDKSDTSRISITSDESKAEENILNTTPMLIESSMDESIINTTKTIKETTPKEASPKTAPVTPLKREGTFTKDEPEVIASPKPNISLSKTPTKPMFLPSAGFTPFHVNKSSSKEKSMLNVTRSVEKRRSSLVDPPRTTRVMFCSPVNNPAVVMQNRRKVIKSNLKGSNKSFVLDESVLLESRPANRKRSYTQSDADDARVKRKRLADGMQQSVDRLSRPRTSSASAKLAEPTTPSKKPVTPKKSEAKLPRTKLPNFAALHQKQFSKMESLDECQERKAKRAKQLLTPTGALNMLERISPKDKAVEPEKPKEALENSKEDPKKPETPIKSLPTFKSLNPGYTRFGFKLNLDVNPFSIPSKTQPKPKENKPNVLTRQPMLPSLTGATSIRREVAKQTVMREKSFTDRRSVKRTENRTVIKGVRTNRRFELQMRMRDI